MEDSAVKKGLSIDIKKYLSYKYIMRAIVLIYFAICFCRFIFPDSFILVINGGIFDNIYYKNTDLVQSLLRWGHYTSYVIYPMAIFFDSRLFKNIAVYFCLPISIATAFHFDQFITYYMAPGGRGIWMPQSFREFYLAMELGFAIAIPILIVIFGRHWFNIFDKKEWLNFFIALPLVIINLCPIYIPQSLLGYTGLGFDFLSFGNFLWIFLIVVEVILLYVIFRFKEYKIRYMVCVFLALSVFAEYNSLFLMGFILKRLPLQLCNIGTYFFVIALLIKNQKFFNFVYLANVMGGILAIIAPDATGGFAEFWNFHYIMEHLHVLIVPTTCMLLRIFSRIDAPALKHLAIGFTCYFVGVLIVGTIINAYHVQIGQGRVNFFYIFDVDKVREYFPVLAPLLNPLKLGRFTLYPIYQLSVYTAYLFMCFLLYLATLKLYDAIDDHFELRNARIDIYEKLTGKKSKAQRKYADE